eukprot:CAMPEP_0176255900 /NCGR_PEP_ID=MMETSP0121_2-20121125/37273_1 /TAXON_ID=160619 /ORGANISM="Kryptoperidinium foliaceum, Strain CCMP 1326" /LENGTH=69 /DNA_ID=CAMNT_0017595729 /DNA_START=17 /DNA_END=226 /DNA_ORIENTATION=+
MSPPSDLTTVSPSQVMSMPQDHQCARSTVRLSCPVSVSHNARDMCPAVARLSPEPERAKNAVGSTCRMV